MLEHQQEHRFWSVMNRKETDFFVVSGSHKKEKHARSTLTLTYDPFVIV